MKIDNSRAMAWHRCPALYQEKYVNGIEKDWTRNGPTAATFGKRVHELLENHFRELGGLPTVAYEPLTGLGADFEDEAQAMFAGYCAAYPTEDFDVVAVERVFEIPLPNSHHTYTGKFDGVIRYRNTDALAILEHKTEARNAKNNLPQVWASRSQVGLYIWAAEQLYGEPFQDILLDVLTRQSPKGQMPAGFRRDHLQRSEEQKGEAVGNLLWVADQIERMQAEFPNSMWPQDRNQCCVAGFNCEFAQLHLYGRDELALLQFKPAEEYLTL